MGAQMSPSFEQERDGSMREVPEMEVRSLETLSDKAGVIVHSSGELTITGTQQGVSASSRAGDWWYTAICKVAFT